MRLARLEMAAMAILTFVFCQPAKAQHTQAEVHQFFGPVMSSPPAPGTVPPLSAADLTRNPNIILPGFGGTIYLPMWIRPLPGDNPAGFTSIRAYRFEIHAVPDHLTLSEFSFVGGEMRDLGYPTLTQPTAGDMSAATGGNPGFRLVNAMGAFGGLDSLMRSDGLGRPFDNAALGAYYVGYVGIRLQPFTCCGSLMLYFNTPRTVTGAYQTNGGTGSLTTVGLGANDPGDGLPNTARYDAPTLDVLGTAANRFSRTAPPSCLAGDAVIALDFVYPTSPPGTPSRVQATDGTYCDRVRVTWDQGPSCDQFQPFTYTVWRNTTNDSASAQQIGSSCVSSFNDLTAAPGALHYYWVRGDSTVSNGCISAFSSADTGFRCRRGDMNNDGLFDAADLQAFVGCLVSGSAAGACTPADMDGDGGTNSRDQCLFIATLLERANPVCP